MFFNFFIKGEKEIDVESLGARNEEYVHYLHDLQEGRTDECRYGLYDFEYTHQCEGTSEFSKKQRIFLNSWCSKTAKIKKILNSSLFDGLKESEVGVQHIQATDLFKDSQEDVNRREAWIY